MRRIVHLSDIHFGRVDEIVAEDVVRAVNQLEPHVVVVSGDLTQRARNEEFRMAKQFLSRLPGPQIIVPGNHDVPLYNIYDRFARPMEKFRRYISPESMPSYIDDEIAIIGISTARSLTIKGGRINDKQVAKIHSAMSGLPDHVLKIVVTHHPFDLPEGVDPRSIVGRASVAMPLLAECGADLFLAGHMHISGVHDTAKRYKLEGGRSALVVQAGTAASVRGRGEAPSFNLIAFEDRRLVIQKMEYVDTANGFQMAETNTFKRGTTGWDAVPSRG